MIIKKKFIYAMLTGILSIGICEMAGAQNKPSLESIVRDSDRFSVAAVPFTGDLDRDAVIVDTVPLGGLYWLERARDDGIDELSPGQAAANLVTCAPFVNRDPHRTEQLFTVVTQLMAQNPVCRLRFGKPVHFWDMLQGEKHRGLA